VDGMSRRRLLLLYDLGYADNEKRQINGSAQLVVLANGFQKKTIKTPRSKIDKALKIKIEYEQDRK
jgi:hypothetical protein